MHPRDNHSTQVKRLRDAQPWFQNYIQSFTESHIQSSDSINLWSLPSTGVTQTISKLHNIDSLDFIHLDTSLMPITDIQQFYTVLLYVLSSRYPSVNTANKKDSVLNTTLFVKDITDKGKKLCIIIDNMDDLVNLNPKFLQSIRSLRSSFIGKICFVFISHHPLYEHKYYKKFPRFLDIAIHKEIIANIFIDGFNYPKDIELQDKFSKETKTLAMNLAGGNSGLYSKIIRNLDKAQDQKISIQKLLDDPSVQIRLKRIYTSFYKEEKQFLKEIALNLPESSNLKPTAYIEKSGIYKNKKIQIGLLEYWLGNNQDSKDNSKKVLDKTPKLSVDFDTGEIYKGSIKQNHRLSISEIEIIKQLKSQKTTVTKDQLANLIWQDRAEDKYSEWAIVKKISRIRKKFNDNTKPYKYIVTIKGRGFKMQNVKKVYSE